MPAQAETADSQLLASALRAHFLVRTLTYRRPHEPNQGAASNHLAVVTMLEFGLGAACPLLSGSNE